MRTRIPVENNDTLAAVRGFFKQLLEADVVDALLVPMETPAGTITPALVTDPNLLDAANPLAPVMGLNAARVVGHVSVREPRGRIGAVLRSCELRALVELVKLQQASLDDLVTIGVDCLGTYDVTTYTAMYNDGGVDMTALLEAAQSGELDSEDELCYLCGLCVRMCEDLIGQSAISFVGRGVDREVGTPFLQFSDACIACGAYVKLLNEVLNYGSRRKCAGIDARFTLV